MATLTVQAPARTFPAQEVQNRLRSELEQIATDGAVLRPPWEPLLDSQRVVGSVLALESLFPFRLPPDKIVRKGGYNSVDEALDDMVGRVERIWAERQ